MSRCLVRCHANAMVLETAREPTNWRVFGKSPRRWAPRYSPRKVARIFCSIVLGEAEKRNIINCLDLQEFGPVENR